MKMLVRCLSLTGLIIYTGFIYLLFRFSGMSDSSTEPAAGNILYFCVSPFLYLLYCFISTFNFLKGRMLLISGIVAHLAILPLIGLTISGGGMAVVGVGGLGLMVAWFGMYFERKPKADE